MSELNILVEIHSLILSLVFCYQAHAHTHTVHGISSSHGNNPDEAIERSNKPAQSLMYDNDDDDIMLLHMPKILIQ